MKKTWRKAIRRQYQSYIEQASARWPSEYRRLTPAELRQVVHLACREIDLRGGLTACPRLSAIPIRDDQMYISAIGLYVS